MLLTNKRACFTHFFMYFGATTNIGDASELEMDASIDTFDGKRPREPELLLRVGEIVVIVGNARTPSALSTGGICEPLVTTDIKEGE